MNQVHRIKLVAPLACSFSTSLLLTATFQLLGGCRSDSLLNKGDVPRIFTGSGTESKRSLEVAMSEC